MGSELFYLVLTALLNSVLWVPVVIGYVRTRGLLQPEDYVQAPDSPLPEWVKRANRAHMNAVENLSPFAAIVIVGALTGALNDTTRLLAAAFFFARLAHAVVHVSGFKHFRLRTVLFTIGNAATIVLGIIVVMHIASL